MLTPTGTPAGDLRIDTNDFKASAWKATRHNGESWEYCECYELVSGRWEGFVAMQRPYADAR